MRVLSVNVGLPRDVRWRERLVSTAIFKEPVTGSRHVAGINLQGDGQADLNLHGGPEKAVYVYPVEHYAFWRGELEQDIPWGMFGENLTVEGMPLEDSMAIGDRLRIGSAEFLVTQPRLPCFKLGIRFGDPGMVRRFLQADRTGYYLRILAAGDIEAGDEIRVVSRDTAGIPVSAITHAFTRKQHEPELLRRLVGIAALPESWRAYFDHQLELGSGARASAPSLDRDPAGA